MSCAHMALHDLVIGCRSLLSWLRSASSGMTYTRARSRPPHQQPQPAAAMASQVLLPMNQLPVTACRMRAKQQMQAVMRGGHISVCVGCVWVSSMEPWLCWTCMQHMWHAGWRRWWPCWTAQVRATAVRFCMQLPVIVQGQLAVLSTPCCTNMEDRQQYGNKWY
jgi:hypothetical protein